MARANNHEKPDTPADLESAKRALVLQQLSARPQQRNPRSKIPHRQADEVAPVSFGQEQIWLHSQLAPEVPLYTESLTICRNGPLDPDALVTSFREIVRRHEIWRTTFVWSEGRLIQQVHTEGEPRIRVADLRHLPQKEREASALQLAAEDLRAPFDLSREPGVRARLVTLSDTDHRLFLCLHHMVFDGISIYRVFLPELAALYEANVSGTPCVLEEPPLQYADFACWQRRSAGEAALGPLVAYWRKQLSGAPSMIDLPADHPRPHKQSFRGGLVRFQFPADLTAMVRSTALHENCTLFMLLLASFAATLHRYSGQTDMVIGSVSGGRDHPELERLIGYFLRMLVIRTDLRGNPTFREILRRVREVLLGALCHDALPFQRLVQAVACERDLSRSPLFQVTFSIEPPMPGLGPLWDLTEMDAGAAVSKFDLSVELEDRGEVISGRAIYSLDLFEAPTISRLLSDWKLLLRPSRTLAEPEPGAGRRPSMRDQLIVVAGGGGFIGGNLIRDLRRQGYRRIRAVDIKPLAEWHQRFDEAENLSLDLRLKESCETAVGGAVQVFNLAADMGGMGFIETHKAACMLSVLINTQLLLAAQKCEVERYFFASSACVYNAGKQRDPNNPGLKEQDAYPALPEDGYGWEKLFSERMCRHFREDYGIQTRVARYHNVYGPFGTWHGGREKAPAAICRKVIEAKLSGNHQIVIWGSGSQTRSFMYIDDCVKGTQMIMNSGILEPLNLGSSEMVTIDQLTDIVEEISGVKLKRIYDPTAPKGVNGRNSDNTLIREYLNWEPSIPLRTGMERTYAWIHDEYLRAQAGRAAMIAG